MRETRTPGSVRGVLSNGHSYRDSGCGEVMCICQAAWASRPFCAYGRGPIRVTKSRCWNARAVRMRVPSSSGTENSVKVS